MDASTTVQVRRIPTWGHFHREGKEWQHFEWKLDYRTDSANVCETVGLVGKTGLSLCCMIVTSGTCKVLGVAWAIGFHFCPRH